MRWATVQAIDVKFSQDFTHQKSLESIFTNIMEHRYRLFTSSQKKTNCYPLTLPHLNNVTTLPCKMHNFFIWLKVCCIPPNVGGSEKSRFWVDIGGSEKNRLWCVANGMSGKQRYSKCSKWPPSVRSHASSLFCHWSTASSTTLCWNSAISQQHASATRPYRGLMVLDTREKNEKFVHFTR